MKAATHLTTVPPCFSTSALVRDCNPCSNASADSLSVAPHFPFHLLSISAGNFPNSSSCTLCKLCFWVEFPVPRLPTNTTQPHRGSLSSLYLAGKAICGGAAAPSLSSFPFSLFPSPFPSFSSIFFSYFLLSVRVCCCWERWGYFCPFPCHFVNLMTWQWLCWEKDGILND